MKSEKAEEYIEEHILRYSYGGDFWSNDAESAVEIAEQEAEERIRHKAERAFYYSCPFCDGDGGCKRSKKACQMGCKTAKEFINELNK